MVMLVREELTEVEVAHHCVQHHAQHRTHHLHNKLKSVDSSRYTIRHQPYTTSQHALCPGKVWSSHLCIWLRCERVRVNYVVSTAALVCPAITGYTTV